MNLLYASPNGDLWMNRLAHVNRSALESFAADDTLCHLVGQQMSIPTVRTWVHDKTIVLGIQDHRLPNVSEATCDIGKRGLSNQSSEILVV